MLFLLAVFLMVSCANDCNESTWYEDLDQDGLGNPLVHVDSCDQPSGYVSNGTDADDDNPGEAALHSAWDEFDEDNFNIFLVSSVVAGYVN